GAHGPAVRARGDEPLLGARARGGRARGEGAPPSDPGDAGGGARAHRRGDLDDRPLVRGSQEEPSRPLAGRRIVSLAQNVPGPLAVRRLRELGAAIDKVEPPGGDPLETY